MGAINFSIDIELVKFLKRLLPINTFVETGTYEGDTINSVLNYFETIFSVEISQHYYQKAQIRFSERAHVHLYQNNSPEFIQELQSVIQDCPCLYWLDAHWCATEGNELQSSQCPLIEEIKSIAVLNDKSIILIDDARLFVCPPPKPHIIAQWPKFSEIICELQNISNNHEILILNDVILYVPLSISHELNLYAHHNGVDWLIITHQAKNTEALLSQLKEKENEISNFSVHMKEKENEIISLSVHIENLLDQLMDKDIEIRNLSTIADERNLLLHHINDEAIKRLAGMESLSEHISWQKEQITAQEVQDAGLKEQIASQNDQIASQKEQISQQEERILYVSKLSLEFRHKYESTFDFKARQKLAQVYQLLKINKLNKVK